MNIMKKLLLKYTSVSLMLRIFIGLVIGAILGLTLPGLTGIGILGRIFVSALKGIAPVLVAVLVLRTPALMYDLIPLFLAGLACGALTGTTYPIDRHMTAAALGFAKGPMMNSLDGVSDRDYALEVMSDLSILMMHLSRFSEEVIQWCS